MPPLLAIYNVFDDATFKTAQAMVEQSDVRGFIDRLPNRSGTPMIRCLNGLSVPLIVLRFRSTCAHKRFAKYLLRHLGVTS